MLMPPASPGPFTRGEVLETAKRAAFEAVAGHRSITPYTVGIAVHAALAVLLRPEGRAGLSGPVVERGTPGGWYRAGFAMAAPAAAPLRPGLSPGGLDATAADVSARYRALEALAEAARREHGDHVGEDGCHVCLALERLDCAS